MTRAVGIAHDVRGESDLVLHAADMRKDYALAGLDEADLDADPIRQFARWFAEAQAAGVPEPNAMMLATASPDGEPAARIVLLKGFDERGFVFYSNYESPKGRDLDAESARRADVLLAGTGTAGADLRRGRADQPRRIASLFRQPSGGQPASAPVSPGRARSSPVGTYLEREFARLEAAFGEGAVPAARLLGRVPRRAGVDRVLAGTPQPAP